MPCAAWQTSSTMSPTTTYPIDVVAAGRRARAAAARIVRERLRLPPKLTGSQWADRYRMLSPEASAEPGPWRTDRAPYLREIMDVVTGREYADITVVKCSQSGGTEVINNAVGYYIDQEPSPILVIQPNVKPMAQAWSKERLAPMIRDSPRLRGKVKDAKSRNSGNTIEQKVFPGGVISIVGANSPAGLASRPIRFLAGDEMDRWGPSAGTEGDPWALGVARLTTFRHRAKRLKVSSPGNEGESRIETEWDVSDQRHYYMPCPHCGEMQPLEWRDSGGRPDIRMGKGAFRLVWDKEETDGRAVHRPETAAYLCRGCGALIDESAKPWMLARGAWIKHNPASRRAGFFVSGLLSPWLRWSQIAEEWLAAKDDPEKRKTFINTRLGLLYALEGEDVDPSKLASGSRLERYTAEVPRGVGLLTLAVDVQKDRLEAAIWGWGRDEECWLIRHELILGAPTTPETWAAVQELLDRPWVHESGAVLRIDRAAIDAGYETDTVYRWVAPRQARGVYAVQGKDTLEVPVKRASRANRDGVKLFAFNPTQLKDVLFPRLRRVAPGAGYIHFGLHEQTGTSDEFFRQFGAEKRVWERGKVRYLKLAGRRNEAIDLYTMGLVALRSRPRVFRETLGQRAEELKPTPPPTDKPARRPQPARGGGWVNSWR